MTSAPPATSSPIIRAELDTPVRFNDYARQRITGDTWATAWAEDDELYTVIDDVQEHQEMQAGLGSRNVLIASFGATTPPDLGLRLVNSLDAYGHAGKLGADGACWKGNGLTSVDGALYLSVSRHWYGKPEQNNIQLSQHATILRSTDHGATWSDTPPAGEPFPQPMFPGPNFATPFFVMYGKDGQPPNSVPDQSDRYVYAVSTDGYWDNGNAMHLGRVARSDMAALNAEHWEFFTGMDGEQPRWQRGLGGLEACAPILEAAGRCGQTGVQYIPGLNRYILPQWWYPELKASEFNVAHSIWEFYEAPHPWGPWTLFQTWDWPTEGFYNPCILNKSISATNRTMWVLTTGEFMTFAAPLEATKYTLYMLRLTLYTG